MDEPPAADDAGTVASCAVVVDVEVWTLEGVPDVMATPVDVLAEIALVDVLAEVAPVDVLAKNVGVVGGRAVRMAR